MPRSMYCFYDVIPNFELLVICRNYRIKLRTGCWSVNDFATTFPGQIQMTGNKISMKMCFKNILDCCVVFFSAVQIRLDFTQGIKNRGLAVTFKIVSSLSDASRIYLFDFHNLKFWQN